MTDAATDGRTARRDRNRDAVLDAAIDLFREEAIFPGPARVAERAGLSRRSVQRYFDDTDAMLRAAMARHLERVAPLFEVEGLGVGPLPDRVSRLVEARLRLHGALAPMARAARHRARVSAPIRGRLVESRELLLAQVEAMFAPELDGLPVDERTEVVGGLDVVVGFEALEHLLHDRGLDEDVARRVLVRSLSALVIAV